MHKQCVTCGRAFVARYQWHRLCWECWDENRRYDVAMGVPAGRELERQMQALTDELDWWKRVAKDLSERVPDVAMIRRLLQLCHPDKHQNSQAAITATQWLLRQRENRQ